MPFATLPSVERRGRRPRSPGHIDQASPARVQTAASRRSRRRRSRTPSSSSCSIVPPVRASVSPGPRMSRSTTCAGFEVVDSRSTSSASASASVRLARMEVLVRGGGDADHEPHVLARVPLHALRDLDDRDPGLADHLAVLEHPVQDRDALAEEGVGDLLRGRASTRRSRGRCCRRPRAVRRPCGSPPPSWPATRPGERVRASIIRSSLTRHTPGTAEARLSPARAGPYSSRAARVISRLSVHALG